MNQAVIRLLERPRVYLAWQRPFVASKLGPVWRHTDRSTVRRVLDVGCGPGTNSAEFKGLDYTGIDLNPSYIDYARRRHRTNFEVADVRSDRVPGKGSYDFVLVNSLLHHIDDQSVSSLLADLRDYVSDDGHIHVIELELPEARGLSRFLARSDRGAYPRSLTAWRTLLTEHFDEVVFEPFPVPAHGPMLWSMVYFKGRRRP
jgi:2-polyprenyl-3-methyl-5-hydroxy-6-metoxy-1,4-benzoquinol methylase